MEFMFSTGEVNKERYKTQLSNLQSINVVHTTCTSLKQEDNAFPHVHFMSGLNMFINQWHEMHK